MEKHEQGEELKGGKLTRTLGKIEALAKYSYASALSNEVKEALLCYNLKKRFTENIHDFVEDYSDLLEGSWEENREVFISRFAIYINAKSAEIHRELKEEGIPSLPSLSSDLTPEQILNERSSWLESVDGFLRPKYLNYVAKRNNVELPQLNHKDFGIAEIILEHGPITASRIATKYQKKYIRNVDDEHDNCHDDNVRSIMKRKLVAYGFHNRMDNRGYRPPQEKDQVVLIKRLVKEHFEKEG